MFHWLHRLNSWFLDEELLEIASSYDREESVARLQKVTRPWACRFGAPCRESLMGHVGSSVVSLAHYEPRQGRNSFRPVFYGQWEERDGNVWLRGRFSVSVSSQAFLFCWFGMLGMFAIAALTAMVGESDWEQWWILLIMLAMAYGAWLMVTLGRLSAQQDEKWIERAIQDALSLKRPMAGQALSDGIGVSAQATGPRC